jgi:hypothetical protein
MWLRSSVLRDFSPSLEDWCSTLQEHYAVRNADNEHRVTGTISLENEDLKCTRPDNGGREAGTSYRGSTILRSFCFSQYYYHANLTTNLLRPSQSHFETKGQSFDLLYRFLVGPPLFVGPKPLSVTQSAQLRTPENSHYRWCNISRWPWYQPVFTAYICISILLVKN